jgi:hypothetical protein
MDNASGGVWLPDGQSPPGNGRFQIVQADDDPDDMKWEFAPGATVRCRQQTDSSGKEIMRVYEEIAKKKFWRINRHAIRPIQTEYAIHMGSC